MTNVRYGENSGRDANGALCRLMTHRGRERHASRTRNIVGACDEQHQDLVDQRIHLLGRDALARDRDLRFFPRSMKVDPGSAARRAAALGEPRRGIPSFFAAAPPMHASANQK
jgi:hypothetical protein